MRLIAAVDSNWGIGNENELLIRIPNDMRMFQQVTMGKVVVMGRKTFESLPYKKILDGRTNIILTSNQNYQVKGAVICHSFKECFDYVKKYSPDDVYVIGGAEIYKQFLPYCEMAMITKIGYKYQADVFLENLDKSDCWKLSEESEEQTYYDLEYTFCIYVKS